MEYKQFRISANRHLVSCKQMMKLVTDNAVKADDKNKLCYESYYLSGYIIEAMLSYALCSFLAIKGDCMESKPFKEDSNKFKVHNLHLKYKYAVDNGCKGLLGLVFLSSSHSDKALQKLFNDWDVKYRYENYHIQDPGLLLKYISEIEKIYQTILTKYTV